VSRESPDAVNGWRLEASKLSKSRNWNFYRTFDHVLVRYLAAGDARPLLDLIVNLSRPPGRRAGEFVAAITDGKALIDRIGGLSDLPPIDMRGRLHHCAPLYEIRISERRGRGRPKAKAEGEDAAKSESCFRLLLGFCALATGEQPPKQFWGGFAKALSFNEEIWLDHTFPFEAELVRTDGRLGRPCDPELPIRDQALGFAMAKKIEDGLKYESGLDAVRADIEAMHKAGERGGWAEPSTIRAAYDKLKPKI
jgi:hypothetical protein